MHYMFALHTCHFFSYVRVHTPQKNKEIYVYTIIPQCVYERFEYLLHSLLSLSLFKAHINECVHICSLIILRRQISKIIILF
jgi:hypothetical protein